MINPILASSARRRMRSLRTPFIVTLYCAALMAFAFFFSFRDFLEPTLTIAQMRKGVEGYTLLVGVQFALLMLVAPAMTAGSIAGERERQTLDLLRVTNTSSIGIAFGKLLESFGFLCLLILSSMPVLSLILITGGVSLLQLVISVAYLLLSSLAALSVGLFASSLLKRTVTATVTAYLSIFALGALTLLPLFWDTARLGALYDAAHNAGVAMTEVEHAPVSFVISPALGLLSLLASQTQADLVNQLFARFSHTLNVTFRYLNFERYLLYHMVFLVCVTALLIAASALLIRPRRRERMARKRTKA